MPHSDPEKKKEWQKRKNGKRKDKIPPPDHLADKAAEMKVEWPSKKTVKKYGLMPEDRWWKLLAGQHWKCAICGNFIRKPAVDHEHVPGWAKKPQKERRKYVRGLLCYYCNYRVLNRHSTDRIRACLRYLERYERRRDNGDS